MRRRIRPRPQRHNLEVGSKTFGFFREKILEGFDALLLYLSLAETKAGLAREAAAVISEVGANEWGSYRSTLSRSTKWLAEPDMQEHLADGEFSLKKAVQEGWSIYVVLPPTDVPAFRSWLRLITRTAIEAKVAMGVYQDGPRTLFILDEFAALGHLKIIEDSAGFMAGYGMKLVPIIQNVGQLQSLYGRNWETFLGNAGAIIAFGLNDGESEKYIADRLGRVIVSEVSRGNNFGASGQMIGGSVSSGDSWNVSRTERPVRFPNEIHEQGARETMRAFIIPASGRAFTVRRQSYMSLPPGTYETPEFIRGWETRFASLLSPQSQTEKE